MESSKPPLQNSGHLVHLEAVEEVLNYCETLEAVVNKVKEILENENLNDALLDIYDPEREPASEDICKAFLAIKQVLAKVV